MLSAGYPGMAAPPIIDPGASSCAVEPRLIQDSEMAHPIAFLVEDRGARRNGSTTTASKQRHGNGSKHNATVQGHDILRFDQTENGNDICKSNAISSEMINDKQRRND